MKEEEEVSFLNKDRLNESEKKIETGELSCNTDSPEECEACGA